MQVVNFSNTWTKKNDGNVTTRTRPNLSNATGTLVDWAENASGEENFSPFLLNKTSKILAISTLSFVNSIHTIGFAIQ